MLQQAVAKNDIPQVAHASHRIKGASKMIGATALARRADQRRLEARRGDAALRQRAQHLRDVDWMPLVQQIQEVGGRTNAQQSSD